MCINTLTHYHESKKLLQFLADNFSDYEVQKIIVMLEQVGLELEEKMKESTKINALIL